MNCSLYGCSVFFLVASSPFSRCLGEECGLCVCTFLIKAEVLLPPVVFVPFCLSCPWVTSFLCGCLVPCGSLIVSLPPSELGAGIVWILGFPCVSLWILGPQLVALFCKIVEPLEFRSSWINLVAGLGLQVCSPTLLSWAIYVRGGGYLMLLTPQRRITHANLPYPSWWSTPEIDEPKWSLLLSCLLSGVVTAIRELTNPESLSLRSD